MAVISIIITVFNDEQYIEEAVRSILSSNDD